MKTKILVWIAKHMIGKKIKVRFSTFLLFLLTVSVTMHASRLGAVEWAQWTSASVGTPGTVYGRINTVDVDVTYTGEVQDLVPNYPSWMPVNSFSGGTVFNAPPSAGGIIQLFGGKAGLNTISFSKPVIDPVLAIWSLGGNGNGASFVFQTTQPITIESGGPSSEYGGSSITRIGNAIYGTEGNGTIVFHGNFTEISWTNPSVVSLK